MSFFKRGSIGVVIVLVVFIVQLSTIHSKSPFHTDEVSWSRVGVDAYRKMFVERDIKSVWWLKSQATFGLQNPNIGKYLIGASLWHSGVTDSKLILRDDDGGFSQERIRIFARLPTIMSFTIFLLTFYFLMILITDSVFVAIITLLMLIEEPTIAFYARLATLDIMALTFSSLAITLLLFSLQTRINRGYTLLILFTSLLSWIFAGLALSTKMNALLLVFSMGIIYLINIIYVNRLRLELFLELIAGGLIALAIFVFSNPALISEPLAIEAMLSFGTQAVRGKQEIFADAAITTVFAQITTFYEIVFQRNWGVVSVILFLVGLIYLIRLNTKSAKFYLIVLLILNIGVFLWTPLAWSRYYLPAIFILMPVKAIGLWQILIFININFLKIPKVKFLSCTDKSDRLSVDDTISQGSKTLSITSLVRAKNVFIATILTIVFSFAVLLYFTVEHLSSDQHFKMARSYSVEEDTHWIVRKHLENAVMQDDFEEVFTKANAYYFLAMEMWYAQDDTKEILETFVVAVSLNPNHYWANRFAGEFEWKVSRDLQEAERLLKRAIAINSKLPGAYIALAEIYGESGDEAKRCEMYKSVLLIKPKHEVALERISSCE